GQQVLVDGEEIGAAEIGRQRVLLLPRGQRQAQILGIAEQVAVFPEHPRPRPFAGVVAEPGARSVASMVMRTRPGSAGSAAGVILTVLNSPLAVSASRVSSTLRLSKTSPGRHLTRRST